MQVISLEDNSQELLSILTDKDADAYLYEFNPF